jgi:transaldolase
MNPLLELQKHGQSYWLDDLTRTMIETGDLRSRVELRGLRGVTSNPAIFHRAIVDGAGYDDEIERMLAAQRSASEIYEAIVTADVRDACDVLRPVFARSDGQDGYVSLEVSPHLAHDADASIAEALRLRARVERPNALIKIPGTVAGLRAIETLLFEGIGVNVTLLFSVERYEAVAQAYLRALERRLAAGRDLASVASVASFFLSRIDVLVDGLLERAGDAALRGQVAVANAKLAYRRFERLTDDARWRALEARGARVQRLLWASTSVKNPSYRDVAYVEPLIGPHTVTTLPEATIAAFEDHGLVQPTLTRGVENAERIMSRLEVLGIDFSAAAEQLLNEGLRKFIEPYDALLAEIEARRKRRGGRRLSAGAENRESALREARDE